MYYFQYICASMKKKLLILLTLVTLFAVVLENYKSFFNNPADIELSLKDDAEGKDYGKSIEKDDLDVKESCFAQGCTTSFVSVTKSKFYIAHSNLLPAPCTSLLEMPPEQQA
jgi:hypothetical protein